MLESELPFQTPPLKIPDNTRGLLVLLPFSVKKLSPAQRAQSEP